MKNLDLELLIPHRPPALIVTGVESQGQGSLIATGQIDHHHPMAVQKSVPSILAMEFAAQSAGLLLGLLQSMGDSDTPAPTEGYLVSLQDVRLERPELSVDGSLVANVQLEGRLGSMALFSVTVWEDGETVAKGRLAVATQKGKPR
jgi:predicted hotdog family 3-hydroxylacyl-ACP dehydratase